ncbi:MAG: ABC transporter ATP-binding protein [Candidatus Bathyarchaeota archaeon B26-2]|nr:MAG: ABC transporter ATP-binding protein [Candidatus Bathyarchaeota archaeon B26-2]
MPLKDLIKNLNIVNPKDVTIRLNEKKDSLTLLLKGENAIYTDVIPEMPFPISYPEFVILKDAKGSDICTIKNMKKLDKESRRNLERLLDKMYFIPKIVKIIRLEASGDKFEWETITNKGRRRFKTRGRSSVTFIGNKIVISDTDDNLYEIEDIQSLDRKSKAIIQSTF